MVQRAVLDSLVFQEADGTFSPWLATDWSRADGTAYMFTLARRRDLPRRRARSTHAAVKANFDRIADPAETASAQAASMLGADFYEGTKVIDDHTVG